MRSAIIMAAGKGTRMYSDLPKVLHKVANKTMVDNILDSLHEIDVDQVVTVVGYGSQLVMDEIKDRCQYAIQSEQLGTAHAVMQASQLEHLQGETLVINGDCPCILSSTLKMLLDEAKENDMVVLTTKLDDAKAYGRIVRNQEGYIVRIVEFKDCSEDEACIQEINTGIYCFKNEALFKYLKLVKNDNAQKEYYITDLVRIFNEHHLKVKAVLSNNPEEVQGINNKVELAMANAFKRRLINEKLMLEGVTLLDPMHTYIDADVTFGKDCIVYPNVVIEGKCHIADHSVILPNCFIKDSVIGSHSVIDSSRITDSEVGSHVHIGPNSHLRNGCKIADEVRIGNFVELKNTSLGYNTKCAHLTYVGDSVVGSKVNFGCGVVTVNYDGKHKYQTIIKDGAFIGSNVNLIAPVSVGENAVCAAGSTITEDVEDGAMAISRAYQINKPDYGNRYKNK
ncbi:MAG: bifunctional UDP-N-acetylglucosamine diphosphorylase/glucosamine-1-phosphate N-acetyltransferase GlmU [Erysipelotrichaceae bacterium]|nr:bifunctional UDP-N-acetylglucosamine diphosphorylase/glucosamine-1-phosphate N-acetyltransferase GlmU [Erysipelotrichaceae bacterium]